MPSIFLSHSSKDKDFVRELAERLKHFGVKVWLDEAEMNIGDSLTQKIGQAIDEADFVGVVLSRNSVNSDWVQRELQIAIEKELEKRKVVVLPLLLEKVKVPPFLRDKLYADFTTLENFAESFSRLLRTLNVSTGGVNSFIGNQQVDKYRLSANDLEMARSLYVCFDRPAFQQNFEAHTDLDALIAALDDTIAAINTGVKKRRDGIVFGKPTEGKAYFENMELRKAFEQIVSLLSEAKNTYAKARTAGYFFDLRSIGREGLAFHSNHQDKAIAVAVRVDSLRNQVLKIANQIYTRIGMKPFPYIITPSHYLKLAQKKRRQ